MSQDKFNEREWVNDIVTGAITGVAAGAVGALFAPDPPFVDLMVAGGIVGLVTQMIPSPLKWLLNRRPDAPEETLLKGPKS